MPDDQFQVGDTLKCLTHVSRQDGRSCLCPGDIVKVIQAFEFTYDGKPCQDITVQRDGYFPIACLVEPGRFQRHT